MQWPQRNAPAPAATVARAKIISVKANDKALFAPSGGLFNDW